MIARARRPIRSGAFIVKDNERKVQPFARIRVAKHGCGMPRPSCSSRLASRGCGVVGNPTHLRDALREFLIAATRRDAVCDGLRSNGVGDVQSDLGYV